MNEKRMRVFFVKKLLLKLKRQSKISWYFSFFCLKFKFFFTGYLLNYSNLRVPVFFFATLIKDNDNIF